MIAIRTIRHNSTLVQGVLVSTQNHDSKIIATIDVFGKLYTGELIPTYRKE